MARIFNVHDWERMAGEAKYDPRSFAQMADLSVRQLERQSKRYLRMRLQTWLGSLQIAKAREYLLSGESPKNFIADLGFQSEWNFYEKFRRFTGITPHQFIALMTKTPAFSPSARACK